jgi:large subunit ribosomal protein L9
MKVVLRQDVDKVGLRGEVVDVARGFARNYLLPRRLAEPATPARVAEIERIEEQRARHEAGTFEQAQEVASTLGQTELRFEVKAGPTGVLFGSVTPTDIADELWSSRRIRVDRRKIDLPDPIKRIGRYDIPIEVFTDVSVEVRTLVIPEGGELPPEEEQTPPEPESETPPPEPSAKEASETMAEAPSEAPAEPAEAPDETSDSDT